MNLEKIEYNILLEDFLKTNRGGLEYTDEFFNRYIFFIVNNKNYLFIFQKDTSNGYRLKVKTSLYLPKLKKEYISFSEFKNFTQTNFNEKDFINKFNPIKIQEGLYVITLSDIPINEINKVYEKISLNKNNIDGIILTQLSFLVTFNNEKLLYYTVVF